MGLAAGRPPASRSRGTWLAPGSQGRLCALVNCSASRPLRRVAFGRRTDRPTTSEPMANCPTLGAHTHRDIPSPTPEHPAPVRHTTPRPTPTPAPRGRAWHASYLPSCWQLRHPPPPGTLPGAPTAFIVSPNPASKGFAAAQRRQCNQPPIFQSHSNRQRLAVQLMVSVVATASTHLQTQSYTTDFPGDGRAATMARRGWEVYGCPTLERRLACLTASSP